MSSTTAEQLCRRFSLADILSATGDFSDAHVIGEGGFGKVYRGLIDNGSVTVAIKRLAEKSRQGEAEFESEMKTLTKFRHRNLVSLIGYCREQKEMILVYEYMLNGTLADHLHKRGGLSLSWNQRLKICIGAARGLDYLHSGCSIIHRDVKPTNILLDENLTAKVSDFGLAKHLSADMCEKSHVTASFKGTPGYIDPNFYNTGRLTKASDTYAFGVVLLEVLSGRPPGWFDENEQWMTKWAQERIQNGKAEQIVAANLKGQVSQDCLKRFVRVVERCLHKEPRERLTMTQVVVQLELGLEQQANDPLDNDEFIRKFLIPSSLLEQDTEVQCLPSTPEHPVLVFINSRSGGQLGGELLVTYRCILNAKQVIDLGEESPDSVLGKVYINLQRLKNWGDENASEFEKNLKIIVAGGDGTAGWLLGVVSDLELSQPPPIATMPLGTENNLPFAFGWGKKSPGTDRSSVLAFMNQVQKAKEMKIDSWHILMRMKEPQSCDPVAPLELPLSLHAFHRVSPTDDLNVEGYHTFRGGFWNYFSMGMDAQVSYAFHTERKLNPEKFKNQSTYAKLVGSQGLFLPSNLNNAASIAQICKVKIMKRNFWQDLEIPNSIRSIVCLNLPSFSRGLNPWGTPSVSKRQERDLTPSYVDDGCLEIVGFRNAWHKLVFLAHKGQGIRLAQAQRIRFEFHKGTAQETYMRVDGEPWKQPLPENDETVVVEISRLGQVKMLATHDYRAMSVLDPSSQSSHYDYRIEEIDSDEEDEIVGEEWRKFGAADAFRIPGVEF